MNWAVLDALTWWALAPWCCLWAARQRGLPWLPAWLAGWLVPFGLGLVLVLMIPPPVSSEGRRR